MLLAARFQVRELAAQPGGAVAEPDMRRMETLLSTLLVAISALLGRSHCCDDARGKQRPVCCVGAPEGFSKSVGCFFLSVALKRPDEMLDKCSSSSKTDAEAIRNSACFYATWSKYPKRLTQMLEMTLGVVQPCVYVVLARV